jgi:hypothetical protein
MIIAIIQPGFLPWLGYFEQMAVADVFVYLDDVQYTRKDWRNRNRFMSPEGIKMISVPVRKGAGRKMLIKDARINYDHPWQKETVERIRQWYGQSRYFNDIFLPLEEIIWQDFEFLVDLNCALNNAVMSFLKISVPTFISSDIPNKSNDKNHKIIDICRHHNADVLYDGQAARAFIDQALFEENGIRVIFQNYQHTSYPQMGGEFVSHLSVLDLLMNCGPESRDILLSSPRPSVLQSNMEGI